MQYFYILIVLLHLALQDCSLMLGLLEHQNCLLTMNGPSVTPCTALFILGEQMKQFNYMYPQNLLSNSGPKTTPQLLK
jgi:hypothetical protein